MGQHRFAFCGLAVCVGVAISTFTRSVLLVRAVDSFSVSGWMLTKIAAVGLVYDLAAGVYLSLALLPYLVAVPDRLYRHPLHRFAVHGLFAILCFALVFGATAEWYFWGEFGTRFDFIAVDYLVYTRELLGNIWESYPVPALLFLDGLVALLLVWRLRSRLDATLARPCPLGSRLRAAAGIIAVAGLFFGSLDSSLMQIARERAPNQLAGNGLYGLFSAFRSNSLDYEAHYASEPLDDAFARLRTLLVREPGVVFPENVGLGVTRRVTHAGPERRLNVVLVVMESLSARRLGVFGDETGITPHLDALAAQSLLFTRLYATGTRTVRGLEALTLSLPPTPGRSVIKRPGSEGMFSLGFLFRERGYDTRFLYGGDGYFDNMNHFFSRNGFDVTDRRDLSADEVHFENIWGVADEDLYARALREADLSAAAGRPFFQLIMTTSNHRPYSYPTGRIDIPSGSGRAGAVKYADHALGAFLDLAREHPWFEQTLFAVVADHCAGSAGRTELPLKRYHIPFLVYAPAHVAPGRVDTLGSQIDVGPTLLGLLGWSYTSRFFGRDLRYTDPTDGRALIATYALLGYAKGGVLALLGPRRRAEFLALDASRRNTTTRRLPTDAEGLKDAIAYFQSASWVWEHGAAGRLPEGRVREAVAPVPRL